MGEPDESLRDDLAKARKPKSSKGVKSTKKKRGSDTKMRETTNTSPATTKDTIGSRKPPQGKKKKSNKNVTKPSSTSSTRVDEGMEAKETTGKQKKVGKESDGKKKRNNNSVEGGSAPSSSSSRRPIHPSSPKSKKKDPKKSKATEAASKDETSKPKPGKKSSKSQSTSKRKENGRDVVKSKDHKKKDSKEQKAKELEEMLNSSFTLDDSDNPRLSRKNMGASQGDMSAMDSVLGESGWSSADDSSYEDEIERAEGSGEELQSEPQHQHEEKSSTPRIASSPPNAKLARTPSSSQSKVSKPEDPGLRSSRLSKLAMAATHDSKRSLTSEEISASGWSDADDSSSDLGEENHQHDPEQQKQRQQQPNIPGPIIVPASIATEIRDDSAYYDDYAWSSDEEKPKSNSLDSKDETSGEVDKDEKGDGGGVDLQRKNSNKRKVANNDHMDEGGLDDANLSSGSNAETGEILEETRGETKLEDEETGKLKLDVPHTEEQAPARVKNDKKGRRNKSSPTIYCAVGFCVLMGVVIVLLMVLKHDGDSGQADSPVEPIGDEGADFKYDDAILVSPGQVTSNMASIDFDCNYNNHGSNDFAHVIDQCRCDDEISVIPNDVSSMRELLIDRVLPFFYDPLYLLQASSCDPTNMALIWLASGNYRDGGELRQRYALAVLFFSLDGFIWDNQDGWLTELNECSWLGVDCNGRDVLTGVTLDSNNVGGQLPSEIGRLQGITSISVSRNHVNGTIPTELFSLERLRELRLSENQMIGSLPSHVGKARNLEVLTLDKNFFSGTLCTEISTVSNLADLNIGYNGFNLNIPTEVGNLRKLKFFNISGNAFSGRVPSEIGLLVGLENLTISENNFFGGIPSEVGRLTNLRDFRVVDSGIGHFLPTQIGELSRLQVLEMPKNNIRNWLPSYLGRLSSLVIFAIYENSLSGPIPTEFGRMNSLRELRMEQNALTGNLPSELGLVQRLEVLSVAGNDLVGSAPDEICSLRTKALSTFTADCIAPDSLVGIECAFPICCTSCTGLG